MEPIYKELESVMSAYKHDVQPAVARAVYNGYGMSLFLIILSSSVNKNELHFAARK
jgi:hypothetical protein